MYRYGFLVPGKTQKILTEIWHSFDIKMMLKIYTIEIIFKSHEPFQSYQLADRANSAKKAG